MSEQFQNLIENQQNTDIMVFCWFLLEFGIVQTLWYFAGFLLDFGIAQTLWYFIVFPFCFINMK
jgi:hypothetical protein